jgi:pimeloyl-ACP methyl ester carboxylesterase
MRDGRARCPQRRSSDGWRTSLEELDGPPEALVRSFLPTLFTARAPTDAVAAAASISREFRPQGVRPMLLGMAEADLRDVLPRIHVPTLLLCGAEDVRSPLTVAHTMYAAIPGATLVVLPDVGHQSNIETPAQFNAAVRSFLTGLR